MGGLEVNTAVIWEIMKSVLNLVYFGAGLPKGPKSQMRFDTIKFT